jgi:heterodisulfide reductase subunit B
MALACKEAANYKCQVCGVQSSPEEHNNAKAISVAHVDHDPENPAARLVAMCARCHLQWDHGLHEIVSRNVQNKRRRLEIGYKKKYTIR